MIDSVKGRRKIKKTESSKFSNTGSLSNEIVNGEQDRFSRTEFSVSRLMFVKKFIAVEMGREVSLYDAFIEF